VQFFDEASQLKERPEPEREDNKMIEMDDVMGSEEAQSFVNGPNCTLQVHSQDLEQLDAINRAENDLTPRKSD